MDDKVIELQYSRGDLEEIYFRNGGGKTFFNHHLKKQRNTFITIGIVFLAILVYVLSVKKNYGFLVFASILLCFAFFDWYKKASPGITWKRDIKNYLDKVDKIKNNKIILTENSFSLVQDSKEKIEKWTEFKRVEMDDNFISLDSNATGYVIPKKSMTPEEFQFLKTFLSEKLKKTGNNSN
jgi:hypothetical protein